MVLVTHLARVYARGAFSIASQQKQEGLWLAFIEKLGDALDAVLPLISHPYLRSEDKSSILSQVVEGSPQQHEFLNVLVRHRRLHYIRSIACAFKELLWESQSICVVEVQTPYPLSEQQKELIVNSLSQCSQFNSQVYGKTIQIYETENAELLAGVVCIIGDMAIDLSIQGRFMNAVSVLSRSSV